MKDFSFVMNNAALSFEVAIVKYSDYVINGSIVNYTPELILEKIGDDVNDADSYYVYHFKNSFKLGVNIINIPLPIIFLVQWILACISTMCLLLPTDGEKQIDNFALIIEMGEFESFYISSVFFENADDWKIDGEGTKLHRSVEEIYMTDSPGAQLHIRIGQIVFQQKNYYPLDELLLFTVIYYLYQDIKFDFRTEIHPLPLRYQYLILEPADDNSKSVLRNIP